MSFEKLAELIFPNVDKTPEYYFEKYPKRELKEGAKVLRYAPSPTGFQHIGGVYAALINERLAHQSEGIFYLRIEDTDQKREVAGAIDDTIKTMHNFGMDFDEGVTGENSEKGIYAPYKQSQRAEIYNTFVKDLIKKGLAYPCFMTADELAELREKQIAEKITPGCYGIYAKYRDLAPEEAIKKIEAGEEYVIRMKSPGDEEKRIEFKDMIKGKVSFPENVQDTVIIKGDGLPTYHFAHAIDDYLMGTTHVIRGEEWLSSLPIHLQMFRILGFKAPKYAHVPTIMKLDGSSKRKLSKRKDPESAVSYYSEQGYPTASVVEYLLNIINSSFEDWRKANKTLSYNEFTVELNKMSKSGALFDLVKLHDVSKEVISKMKATEVYDLYQAWAKEYDEEMFRLVSENKDITIAMINIDREGAKPRKDYGNWSEVRANIFYLYDELFNKETAENVELPKGMELEDAKSIIEVYSKVYDFSKDATAWFEQLKEVAVELGYATDRKAYKANPESFKGMVSDVAGAVRAAVTHRTNTPDLYTIMQILGEEKVKERFEAFLAL
ncbi:glutamate--tRNA ligase [Clostridium mediterraneense]|uniref:glutamate--tRNA ligase n=1 Tax=Clostridium mediterraneense TaxID=1805472 RepID=UPI0008344162|nr:glutamate--tRNA ligase [Clostridium mediterraneense]